MPPRFLLSRRTLSAELYLGAYARAGAEWLLAEA